MSVLKKVKVPMINKIRIPNIWFGGNQYIIYRKRAQEVTTQVNFLLIKFWLSFFYLSIFVPINISTNKDNGCPTEHKSWFNNFIILRKF